MGIKRQKSHMKTLRLKNLREIWVTRIRGCGGNPSGTP